MIIRKYQTNDLDELFALMTREGPEWTYNTPENQQKYAHALDRSISFVLTDQQKIYGYIRGRNDDGFDLYILDLLVDPAYRGNSYGQQLIEHFQQEFPEESLYVTSDADPYYLKLGFKIVGSVLEK
ncbi:GNAT family N-acetyltransferase [Enterococcus sp. ALS3]|uniref:GNAT family N-acetyltransferase n=1 Tax=Enterococcus alishanensis TaxID=1303817 RepID=A0ABS6TG30_9ENTE|nr:GNAT family N-acetyltransferase [Enterococcus alishanensis]MBV7391906.1 GNAT family N-acetyltransferase [Enterococcus alishanensis]